MSSSPGYHLFCKNCMLQVNFSTEEFLSLAGPELKRLIDKNDPNPFMTLVSNFAASGPSSSSSKIHEVVCTRCKCPNPLSNAKKSVSNLDLNTIGSQQNKEFNQEMTGYMENVMGEEADQFLSTNKENAKSGEADNAAVLINEMLEEASNEDVPETDPLMIALERVKVMNPKVDPGNFEVGTSRLTYSFRWLVKPLHAFLRVYLFKNLDHYILGSVSIFKAPRASIGKKEMFSSSILGRIKNWCYLNVLPISLAADCFFSSLVIVIIVGLWLSTILLLHYFTYYAAPNNSNEGSTEQHDKNAPHHHESDRKPLPTVSTAESFQHFTSLISTITFIFGALAIYFIFRSIARDPGFLIPKAKVLKIEPGSEMMMISHHHNSHEHRNFEDEFGDDADDENSVENIELRMKTGQEPVKREKSSSSGKNNSAASSKREAPHNVPAGSKFCETCHIWRPPRAAHCKLCNLCVRKSEIHCTAIGVHVGERNYHLYCGFVFCAFAACNFQIIQLSMYLFSYGLNRLSASGWIFFLLTGVFSVMMLMWTGSMWHRQQQNIITGLTSRERVKQEFIDAGVPQSDELTSAVSNVSSAGNSATKNQHAAVDRLLALFTAQVPESDFVLEDRETQE